MRLVACMVADVYPFLLDSLLFHHYQLVALFCTATSTRFPLWSRISVVHTPTEGSMKPEHQSTLRHPPLTRFSVACSCMRTVVDRQHSQTQLRATPCLCRSKRRVAATTRQARKSYPCCASRTCSDPKPLNLITYCRWEKFTYCCNCGN